LRVIQPQTEQRFRTLFEQAPFSVQLLSAEGRTLMVNQSWKDLWGAQDGDPLLTWVLDGYDMLSDPQLEAKGLTPYLRRAFAGEAVRIPAAYYDPAEMGKPGRARWVEATARPILDEAGRVAEVMLIHEDVTERLMAERRLLASELRLKQLANTIPQMAWIADTEGAVEWYNDRWYEYTGTTLDEVKGWGWQTLADPLVLPAVMAAWRHSIDTGDVFQMTVPLRGLDGRYRPFLTLVAPLKDESGQVMNWFGTNTDVSPLHEAEQQRKDGERRKDEFLAMLAHELRNPLAPISTAAQLLKLPGTDAARAARAGDIIERQVRHMTKLVDDLLDVSRVTRGLITLHTETLALKDIVAGALEQVQPLIEATGHALQVPTDLDGLVVSGDRTRLVQVLVNLLNNAAKYSGRGSRIQLQAEALDGTVQIRVTDEGVGIDAAFLPHVFELFTQARRSPDRSQGGLGIGLALVKSLVEMHGGEVRAASPGLGRGSCFVFTLPLVQASEGSLDSALAPLRRDAIGPGQMRILVVDDNADAAETLSMLLQLQGYEVRTASDAEGALSLAPAFAADIYILDIGLPAVDGYELARLLRSHPSVPSATYIALTGYGQEQDRARSQAAGFDLHLVKPVEPGALQQVLSHQATARRA